MDWKERNELVIAAAEHAKKQVKSRWERRVRAREFIACQLAQRGIKLGAQAIQSLSREAVEIAGLEV